MREFTYIPLLIFSLLGLMSCSILNEDSTRTANLSLQTNQTEYIADLKTSSPWPVYGFTLIAKFKNITNQTIYLNRCYPDSNQPIYGVELLSGDSSARSAYNTFWACVGHNNPITVKPGAVRTDTLEIRGPNSGSHGANKGDGVTEGKFRLIYQAQTCREIDGEGCTLPDSLSRSNTFEVRLQK